ncbi:restriction endonuclease subunit S domain-containing protein [Lapidilactobacillus gannanensis]|uniref:Restriction endonuclease subunit S n=1 Tax=Lapidilactobacillus gannanensis TaxID=2486002 RepID=A0ABW4BM96_9LACO|nr:restriction endonuclease subunit S [Lapidilactobacillus gannanensis]
MKLTKIVKLNVGSPQFRINATNDQQAQVYPFYSQVDLEEELTGIYDNMAKNKQIRTHDEVNLLHGGEVIFNLVSGRAAVVSTRHDGYIYTQNFVVLNPTSQLNSQYLVYLLNENHGIQHQLQVGLQGSMVLKYTVRQLRELRLPQLPEYRQQVIIGQIYFKQLRLQALQIRRANNETLLKFAKLAEVSSDEKKHDRIGF